MKTARLLLVATLSALAGASLPARTWGQSPNPYVIDVARREVAGDQRYVMRERVRVEIHGLNPFAGNYQVLVNETVYSDSAIIRFLAGLGISVAVEVPKSQLVATSATGTGLAADQARSLLAILQARRAVRAPSDCAAASSVMEQLDTLESQLRSLDSQDVAILGHLVTVTSERSDSSAVMAALDAVIANLRERASRRHQRPPFRQRAAVITARAEALLPSLGNCPDVQTTLRAILDERQSLDIWAAWRDTLEGRTERNLPALETARTQAGKMFVHVLGVGDYDHPTTVDLTVARQPLGPLSFAARAGQLAEGTADVAPQTGGDADKPDDPPGAPDGLAAGWRTIANPRLHFGERRRIGLSGALVFALGPTTSTYGTAFDTATEETNTSIIEARRERTVAPLLTLTTRLRAFRCWWKMVCAVNLLFGVSPSVTPRQTYFGGLGFAFADERVGLIVGGLSLPVQELASTFDIGDKLSKNQNGAPTTEGRVWRLAVGFNLRPF
jgi:hypothetical protein